MLGRNVSGACEFPLQGRGELALLPARERLGARNAEIGEIDVTFADGSGQTFPVIQNRDIGNWWMPSHFKNATNVWSVENPQCYVGLYLSQFPLKRNDPVRIRLRSGAGACWMIPAISLETPVFRSNSLTKPSILCRGREWATLDFPVTVQKGSVLDFSDQLDAPAGKYGPVRISPEGHFVFAQAPERRIRFFGVNLSYGANFPSRANAEKLAERLAAVGYNVVRFHHQDGGLTGSGDEMFNRENLDRLDYFIAALKKRGIYFMTDLYVSRVRPCYAPLAGAFPVKHYSPALFKALIPILPEAMED
ncbi:MAG: cellulase family glycosylhydrolase [Lentisphaeria bacterium]|nr:MAG: cellulase family glycosylhydrolase [Lentisphaeria bacterium]